MSRELETFATQLHPLPNSSTIAARSTMTSPTAEPSAKRVKTFDLTNDDVGVASTIAEPTAATALFSSSTRFDFTSETGLFKLVSNSLGVNPAEEREVGITQYVDANIPPFQGIIKHRFTDFMVFEVGMDGQVIRLKDIRGPKKEKEAKKERQPEQQKESKDAVVEATEPEQLWNEKSEAMMVPLLSPEKLAEFKIFIETGPPAKQTKDHPKPLFKSDTIESKESRTAFHKGLREAFNSRLSSEMRESEIGGDQYIEVTWKSVNAVRANNGQPRQERRSRAERDAERAHLPPYIHFTLQKTNKEMHDALSGLCRLLSLHTRDIGAAGTKDKRAITVQRLSIKRGNRSVEDLWGVVNSKPKGGGGRGRGRGGGYGDRFAPSRLDWGVRVGDIEYGDVMFRLGMLKGNRFVITLRDVVADSPKTIDRAIETIRDRGFINYYGMQRFGTAPVPTHAIGLALLRGDWALAAHLILMPRQGEADDIALARELFKEDKIQEAVRAIPRRAVAERAVLEFYAKQNSSDHLGALAAIPKNLRTMYVHAWQSYIWNRVTSERVRLFGCSQPIVGDLVLLGEEKEEGAEDVVEETESLEANLEDDTEPTSTHAGPMTVERAIEFSKVAKVKVLSQEDIDSKTYTIFDVVLPMPGFAIVYPEGRLGETYRSIMLEDKIDPSNMFRRQKEYSLGGAYRKIMHLPKDVSYQIMAYTSSNQDLAQSDEDILLGKEPPAVTPYDPEVPLPEGHSLALRLEFTLGVSTYATMALREVLKVRTASAHQKTLTAAMEERLNKDAPVNDETEQTDQPKVEVPTVEGSSAEAEAKEDVEMAQ